MRNAVVFAAGGGGDAVSASVLAHALAEQITVSAIVSWSWDRLLLDPLPGPRTAGDFEGLIAHGDGLFQVPSTAFLTTGGQSTLPRLATHLAMPLLLADPRRGSQGLSRQLRKAAEVFAAELILVLDVGGDILAAGDEPGLRSPLADSLALAAAVESELPTDVLATGLGLDGELTADELDRRLIDLGADEVVTLHSADAVGVEGIWEWHPSEANALLSVAAGGWRGQVESQRDTTITVDDRCTTVFRVDSHKLAGDSIAADLAATTSLDTAELRVRDRRGTTDIDIERRRLATRSHPRSPSANAIAILDQYVKDAAARGTDALTIRRVLELTDATDPSSATAMREQLRQQRPDNFQPPLYITAL
ncbi:DUF1152 domain-containing protein [Nocardia sp. NPDC055053]